MDQLFSERRARLTAERMLRLKEEEITSVEANFQARTLELSEEVDETRAKISNVLHENKKVKSELNTATAKMAALERRLWQSVSSLRDGFSIFDKDSKLVFANEAYLAKFDGLEDVKPGISYHRLVRILVEEGIVNTEGLSDEEWCQSLIARWEDENFVSKVIKLWNGSYLKLIDRKSHGGDIISLAVDITELMTYQIALDEARTLAESANRAKSIFLANMSHEIKTPLNGVIGLAEVLLDSNLNKDQRHFAKTIKSSGETLLHIMNDLLEYSKIEAERIEIINRPFHLEQEIEEVILMFKVKGLSEKLNIFLIYPENAPRTFWGDKIRLKQVFTNLIGNAIKFTKEGSVTIEIIANEKDNACTELICSVKDTGIGIAQENLSQIFNEFTRFQNEEDALVEGTGLGLSISKKFVELMQGHMWVMSDLGQGSNFGFQVTLKNAKKDDFGNNSTDKEPHLNKPQDKHSKKWKILLAEDNKTNQLVFTNMLKDQLFDITITTNGLEAFAHFERYGSDIIFTDISMPKMDGNELAAKIFELEKEKENKTPIVALTAHADTKRCGPAHQFFQCHMAKPFNKTELIDVIQALLAKNIGKENLSQLKN